MKKTNKIILTALFSIVYLMVFGQEPISSPKFKQFLPMKEPFKVLESPIIKFDSSRIGFIKNRFSNQESQVFTRNNGMPILNIAGYDDNMPIYKSDSKIKQSLIIESPKGFEIPKNR